MTLEEISVQFSADISPFASAMDQLSSLISESSHLADAMAGQFYAAGVHAGEGLQSGLLSRRGAVAAAARALADAAASSLREALQIASPSRLTFEVGSFFDEGLLRGIAGGTDKVEKEARHLGNQAASSLDLPDWKAPDFASFSKAPSFPLDAASSAPASPPPLSLTIPLEIDGYRLGVAAIEGINQVRQGTGRVELSL